MNHRKHDIYNKYHRYGKYNKYNGYAKISSAYLDLKRSLGFQVGGRLVDIVYGDPNKDSKVILVDENMNVTGLMDEIAIENNMFVMEIRGLDDKTLEKHKTVKEVLEENKALDITSTTDITVMYRFMVDKSIEKVVLFRERNNEKLYNVGVLRTSNVKNLKMEIFKYMGKVVDLVMHNDTNFKDDVSVTLLPNGPVDVVYKSPDQRDIDLLRAIQGMEKEEYGLLQYGWKRIYMGNQVHIVPMNFDPEVEDIGPYMDIRNIHDVVKFTEQIHSIEKADAENAKYGDSLKRKNLVSLCPVLDDMSTELKIIGPVTSAQYTFTPNGTTEERNVVVFGDEHYPVESCYQPDPRFIKEFETNMQYFSKGSGKYDIERGMAYLQNLIDQVRYNPDMMYIYDYLMYLGKGDKCIDLFVEEDMFSRGVPTEIHGFIFIIISIFNQCIRGSKNQIHTSIQERCRSLFPSIRFHQSDFRAKEYDHSPVVKSVEEEIHFFDEYLQIIMGIKEPENNTILGSRFLDERIKIQDTSKARFINVLMKKQFDKSVLKHEMPRRLVDIKNHLVGMTHMHDLKSDSTELGLFNVNIINVYMIFRILTDKWDKKHFLNTTRCHEQYDYPRISIVYVGNAHAKYINGFFNYYIPSFDNSTRKTVYTSDINDPDCCRYNYQPVVRQKIRSQLTGRYHSMIRNVANRCVKIWVDSEDHTKATSTIESTSTVESTKDKRWIVHGTPTNRQFLSTKKFAYQTINMMRLKFAINNTIDKNWAIFEGLGWKKGVNEDGKEMFTLTKKNFDQIIQEDETVENTGQLNDMIKLFRRGYERLAEKVHIVLSSMGWKEHSDGSLTLNKKAGDISIAIDFLMNDEGKDISIKYKNLAILISELERKKTQGLIEMGWKEDIDGIVKLDIMSKDHILDYELHRDPDLLDRLAEFDEIDMKVIFEDTIGYLKMRQTKSLEVVEIVDNGDGSLTYRGKKLSSAQDVFALSSVKYMNVMEYHQMNRSIRDYIYLENVIKYVTTLSSDKSDDAKGIVKNTAGRVFYV